MNTLMSAHQSHVGRLLSAVETAVRSRSKCP